MIDLGTYMDHIKWGWVKAVKEAEATGDLTELARVLRSESPLRRPTRDLLAQLCDRRRLARKKGGQRTPLFQMSVEHEWRNAVKAVRSARKVTGCTEEVAIAHVAQGLGLDEDKLWEAVHDRVGRGRSGKARPKPK